MALCLPLFAFYASVYVSTEVYGVSSVRMVFSSERIVLLEHVEHIEVLLMKVCEGNDDKRAKEKTISGLLKPLNLIVGSFFIFRQ